jgi:hypothetical protein
MDDIDGVIAEVARGHGIAIGRDDPILVLHTMNQRLLRESTVAQQALLDAYKEELEALASRWSEEASGRADRVLQAALAGVQETMASSVQEEASKVTAALRSEVDAALARVAHRMQDARRIAILNLVAACITLAAAGLLIASRLT